MIVIDVEGRPAPKGSRIAGRTKTGRTFTRPASRYEAPWVEAVKTAAQIAMRHHEQPAPPYRVALEFRLTKPGKYKAEMPWWSTKHDLDKLARAVLDGLVHGGAMADDRHVIALTATKRFAEPGESEGVNAQVEGVLVGAATS
jgi:Holliday junction resolvase RusA-like endonuclease